MDTSGAERWQTKKTVLSFVSLLLAAVSGLGLQMGVAWCLAQTLGEQKSLSGVLCLGTHNAEKVLLSGRTV